MKRAISGELNKENKGFTLIEAVITIAIIAILGAIMVPIIQNNIQSARYARAGSEVATIGKAIVQFRKDLGFWPVRSGAISKRLLFGDIDNDNNGIPDICSIPPGWNSIAASDRLSLYYNLINNSNGYNNVPSATGIPVWNGPYLSDILPDPWGNPYLVNSEWLYTDANPGTPQFDFVNVYVLSAGPERPASIETPFGGSPPPAGSDDITFRLQ